MNIENALEAVNRMITSRLEGRRALSLKRLFGDSSLAGGKRLRARLFLDFCRDCGENAIKAASAIELLHVATLIHDDILDKSAARRGRPALHTKCGIPSSVLYGDFLVSEAFLLMADAGGPSLLGEMIRALSDTLEGEIEEQSRRRDLSMTKKEYLGIVEKKSGSLFGFAARAGLIMRGPGSCIPEKAHRFGLNIGTAYQILDDLGDYFGSEDGRKRFNDFREGVVTLPLIYLFGRCSEAEKNYITEGLTDSAAEAEEVRGRIITLMRHYEVISACCDDARDILNAADAGMKGSDIGRPGIAAFMEEKINYAEKEYRDSRERVCGSERRPPAGKMPQYALR